MNTIENEFDLVVIGAGSGGVRASRMAAQTGAKVAIIENKHLGGTCVNVGCVPKKLFSIGAHFAQDFEDAQGYGWTTQTAFDWPTLRENKNKEIARLNEIYRNILEKNHVALYHGEAILESPHHVRVKDTVLKTKRILIATGGVPHIPTFPGHELAVISDDLFYLEKLPAKMVILGAGYIGVEFACIFANLGVEVTLVHRGPCILRGFDEDIRHFLLAHLIAQGIQVKLEKHVVSLHQAADNTIITTLNSQETLSSNVVLNATGRVPNTAALQLDKLGVALSLRGAVIVDDYFQSSVPSIYALGDVIDKLQLTPVALHEAMAFVATTFQNNPRRVDYNNIPSAVFSHPHVATVGLTEEKAREHYPEIEVYKSTFRPLKYTLTSREEKTFLKLIVDKKSDKVLGVHMVGPEAGEIMQGFAVALKCGATKKQFDETVGIHPTLAEELVTMR